MFLQGDLNSRTLLEGRGKDLLLEALAQREINGGAGPVSLGWQQIRGNDPNKPTLKTSFEPLKKERFTKMDVSSSKVRFLNSFGSEGAGRRGTDILG